MTMRIRRMQTINAVAVSLPHVQPTFKPHRSPPTESQQTTTLISRTVLPLMCKHGQWTCADGKTIISTTNTIGITMHGHFRRIFVQMRQGTGERVSSPHAKPVANGRRRHGMIRGDITKNTFAHVGNRQTQCDLCRTHLVMVPTQMENTTSHPSRE